MMADKPPRRQTASSNKIPGPSPPWHQPRLLYLTTYNVIFAGLWLWVLCRTVGCMAMGYGRWELFSATQGITRWIQTAALVEVGHAFTGLIPSPPSTTALQVITRVIQVWMVWYAFPLTTALSHAYVALLLAWSVADSIRYVYLTMRMWGVASGWVVWVRYSMFVPLYPIGIASEWWLLYRAIEPAGEISRVFVPGVFYGCLVLYVPGAWKMYTYMIKQRRKALGSRRGSV